VAAGVPFYCSIHLYRYRTYVVLPRVLAELSGEPIRIRKENRNESHHLHPPHSRLVRNIRDVMAALASLAPLTRALPASARMTPGRPMDRPQRIRSASGLASRPAVPSDAPTRRGETIVMMTYPEPEV
jgi:hypothetical protein